MDQVQSSCLPIATTVHCLRFSSCRADRRKEHSPLPLSLHCHTLPLEPLPTSACLFGCFPCLGCLILHLVFPWPGTAFSGLGSPDPSLIHHCQAGGALLWLYLTCDSTILNPSIITFSTSDNDRFLEISLLIK